jgi:uncharacterized membrane protein YphA (DoxX/SURF4 family)
MNRTLWVIQWLLAALFLFAGVMKLALPIEKLTAQIVLPGAFLRFIGVAEVLGGLGLVLPGMLRIAESLTLLAAAGLVIIMIGATWLTFTSQGLAAALLPLVTGLLLLFVIRGRWRNVAHAT